MNEMQSATDNFTYIHDIVVLSQLPESYARRTVRSKTDAVRCRRRRPILSPRTDDFTSIALTRPPARASIYRSGSGVVNAIMLRYISSISHGV